VPFRVGDHIRSPTLRGPIFFDNLNDLCFVLDAHCLPSIGGKKVYK